MFEKDYIMREVQKLVQVLKVILGLKKDQKFDEAIGEIENAYIHFFDEDRTTIQSSNINELKRLCSIDGTFSPDLAFSLADIIKEEAAILQMEGQNDKATEKFSLALELYQTAAAEEDAAVPINIMDKIQRLESKLSEG